MTDVTKHMEKAFWALLLGSVSMGVKTLNDISFSVTLLNERVGVVVERVSWHDGELKRQDNRLLRLETTKGR